MTAVGLAQFVAVVSSGLALIPAGAHLVLAPAKLSLEPFDYARAQKLLRGWPRYGLLGLLALLSNAGAALLQRNEPGRALLAAAAALASGLGLLLPLLFAWPADRATERWSDVPVDWRWLRTRWEGSQVAAGALAVLAFLAAATSC